MKNIILFSKHILCFCGFFNFNINIHVLASAFLFFLRLGLLIFALTGFITIIIWIVTNLYIQSIGSGMGIYSGLISTSLIIPNYWSKFNLKLDDQIFTDETINDHLDNFWKNINNLDSNHKIFILLKVKFSDGSYKTLNNLIISNSNDLYIIKQILTTKSKLKMESYMPLTISELILNYKIMLDIDNNIKTNINSLTIKKDPVTFSFKGITLPLSNNLDDWDDFMIKRDLYFNVKSFIKDDETISDVTIFKNKVKILSFKDVQSNNNSFFIRYLDDQIYIIENNKIIFKANKRKTGFINPIKKANRLKNSFLTFDLETRLIDNVMIPYCVSFYDGSKSWSYYLSDFNSHEEMIKKAFESIFIGKYHSSIIYAHNFSAFDGIFILKILSSNLNVVPMIKDGKIIQLKIKIPTTEGDMIFYIRDSYLILPSSLRKLAKSFQVSNKSYFPYEFVNDSNIPLDYIGIKPNFNLWPNISVDEYNNIPSSYWDLKKETIFYCEQDCISLHEILHKFSQLIFINWNVSIHKYPTLPSLTFAIYRSNYLKAKTIPKIGGTMFNDIRESYTGGHTDVYHSYGENLKIYDVNSLYPTAMKYFDMPVGPITFFEGDISRFKVLDLFGFFYVKVTTPEYLERPLLQTRVKTDHGFRTMAPLGSWNMWIFSEEMKCYEKYGYKFEILKGYSFNRANLFEDFIDKLYEIKQNTDKNDSMYLISKLLMNSLYGRFGMDIHLSTNIILNNDILSEFISNDTIIVEDIIDLENGKSLIVYKDFKTINDDEGFIKSSVNISIASSITSYSRIIMAKYLGDHSIKIWMTDTDSLVTDSELESSNKLGDFKLEKVCKEMTFIAPKVYGGIDINDNEFTKVKGYKNNLPYSELKSLLNLDNVIKLEHSKFNKNIIDGNIKVINELYTLQITDSKREIIFENGKFEYTKPYIINDEKIVNNNKINYRIISQ